MDYKKLQNGSDIRGVALEGIEGQQVNLTEEVCHNIGRGFALWLHSRLGKESLRVSVGRDSRLSGEKLAGWLCQAMSQQGVEVTDIGMASTPAMFMSTVSGDQPFDAAVMITASHLPFNRNGFKFFTKDGGLEKKDISEILDYAAEDAVVEVYSLDARQVLVARGCVQAQLSPGIYLVKVDTMVRKVVVK